MSVKSRGKPAHVTPGATALRVPSALDIARFGRKEEPDVGELVKEMRKLKTGLEERHESIKKWTEEASTQMKELGKIGDDTKAALEKECKAGEGLASRMVELEQLVTGMKAALPNGGVKQKSLGEQVTESEQVKKFLEGGRKGHATFQLKAITSLTSGTGGAGDLVVPFRDTTIYRLPDRLLTIRNLISVGQTSSNAIDYVQETGFTNSAAPVAEGAMKPESTLEFTLQTAPVRTIAHWIQASMQILQDVPALQSYIDTRMRYGLAIEEENQILAGDGTGQNLFGIIPQATPYDEARSRPGDTRIDIVRRAMTQVRLAEYRADAIVLHPSDWEEIELTKDGQERYIWANPRGLIGPTLWGLPVIDTTAMQEGEFLVGNFAMSTMLWDRMDAQVDISTEDRDNFVKNMVTIRAEERLALTVHRPEAIVFGDFDTDVSGG